MCVVSPGAQSGQSDPTTGARANRGSKPPCKACRGRAPRPRLRLQLHRCCMSWPRGLEAHPTPFAARSLEGPATRPPDMGKIRPGLRRYARLPSIHWTPLPSCHFAAGHVNCRTVALFCTRNPSRHLGNEPDSSNYAYASETWTGCAVSCGPQPLPRVPSTDLCPSSAPAIVCSPTIPSRERPETRPPWGFLLLGVIEMLARMTPKRQPPRIRLAPTRPTPPAACSGWARSAKEVNSEVLQASE